MYPFSSYDDHSEWNWLRPHAVFLERSPRTGTCSSLDLLSIFLYVSHWHVGELWTSLHHLGWGSPSQAHVLLPLHVVCHRHSYGNLYDAKSILHFLAKPGEDQLQSLPDPDVHCSHFHRDGIWSPHAHGFGPLCSYLLSIKICYYLDPPSHS